MLHQIKAVKELTGLSADTIRYYEKAGLIPSPARSDNGYRTYSEADVAQLNFIKRCKDIGLTLNEIKTLMGIRQDESSTCGKVKSFIQQKRSWVQHQIQELQALEQHLEQLETSCVGGNASIDDCVILASLQ